MALQNNKQNRQIFSQSHQKGREKIQICEIRNEKDEITVDTAKIRDYYFFKKEKIEIKNKRVSKQANKRISIINILDIVIFIVLTQSTTYRDEILSKNMSTNVCFQGTKRN